MIDAPQIHRLRLSTYAHRSLAVGGFSGELRAAEAMSADDSHRNMP
jgi:hypothetical protein